MHFEFSQTFRRSPTQKFTNGFSFAVRFSLRRRSPYNFIFTLNHLHGARHVCVTMRPPNLSRGNHTYPPTEFPFIHVRFLLVSQNLACRFKRERYVLCLFSFLYNKKIISYNITYNKEWSLMLLYYHNEI